MVTAAQGEKTVEGQELLASWPRWICSLGFKLVSFIRGTPAIIMWDVNMKYNFITYIYTYINIYIYIYIYIYI